MQNAMLSEAPPNSPKAGQWILAMDDEPSMRSLIGMVLQSQGWPVQTADGAEESLAAIKVAVQPPSLIICGVLMPRIDGLDLMRRICTRIPGPNVIFISGHLTDVSCWPADLRDHRFIAKPFDDGRLIAAVWDELTDTGASICALVPWILT